jgi:hypothetical protein
VKESVFKNDYSGLYATKREAKRAAKRSQSRLGGRWYVVKLGDSYCNVHEHYLRVHDIKPIYGVTKPYGFLIRLGFLIDKIWRTKK